VYITIQARRRRSCKLSRGTIFARGVNSSYIRGSLFVNRKIVKYSNKVLAPRIVRRYTLSKGSAKGPQGVRNTYCNRSGNCFSS
jgi:hypothetical protein